MNWAQRFKRVVDIDVDICDQCGGVVKIIACMEDLVAIKKILDHLDKKVPGSEQSRFPESRAPLRVRL